VQVPPLFSDVIVSMRCIHVVSKSGLYKGGVFNTKEQWLVPARTQGYLKAKIKKEKNATLLIVTGVK